MTVKGEYQTFYIEKGTDYLFCDGYRPRADSNGTDLGLTYYNPDGITYRGWVDGGSGKLLYQTVQDIPGVGELYFIVWRAQYLPEGTDPVTGDPVPAGWYLFGEDGVLVTEDGVYTVPDTEGVSRQYQVQGSTGIPFCINSLYTVPTAKITTSSGFSLNCSIFLSKDGPPATIIIRFPFT